MKTAKINLDTQHY